MYKKIFLGLLVLSFFLVGSQVQATTLEGVCCESYGYGANMIKTASTYSVLPADQCTVEPGFVGGSKEIVAGNYCSLVISPCDPYGDVNNNGFIDYGDVSMIQQKIAGNLGFTYDQHKRADVDASGALTSVDITYIKNYLAGLSTTFPVCKAHPSVTVLSPNGGETFVQGKSNKISWKGGNSKVQIGLVNKDYVDGESNPGVIGWIELNGQPNGSVDWDGISLKSLSGGGYWTITPGEYKIVAITKSEVGNYCIDIKSMLNCSYDLSDNFFMISPMEKHICPLISQPSPEFCLNGNILAVEDQNQCVVSYKCLVKEEVDNTEEDCLPGYVYNPKTGKKCPVSTINSCKAGHKYDPITGLLCPQQGINFGMLQRVLKRGVRGNDVSLIQTYLGITADGVFGPATEQKVIEWQAKNGLTPDGIFGSQSRSKAGLGN